MGLLSGWFLSEQERRKRAFLEDNKDYGYRDVGQWIDDWRPREFPGLWGGESPDPKVYLDYAGAALPTVTQLQESHQLLANPHSTGPLAVETQRLVQQAERRVLRQLLGRGNPLDDYHLHWTSGATEGLRQIVERLRTVQVLVYAHESHTSVVGMRQVVLERGGRVECVRIAALLEMDFRDRPEVGLLVLPTECNFGGRRYRVKELLSRVPDHWYTVLDVAKAAATGPLELYNADFACLSFYKLFGTPTGLGCILAKKPLPPPVYFGGGSVQAILPDTVVRRKEPSSHGTIHFRGIVQLHAGLDEIGRLGGMDRIRRHAVGVAVECVRRLRSLRHINGEPVVVLYGGWNDWNGDDQDKPGPVIALNLKRADGSYVGYNEVAKLGALHQPALQFRTGCFCNPGACQTELGMTDEEVLFNYEQAGHVCGDQIDIVRGRPTGAIRISFGKDSTWEDMDAFVSFVEQLYVTKEVSSSVRLWDDGPRRVLLTELYVFPIKSCAAQKVDRWKVNEKGRPLFDREFSLVDVDGAAMRLQAYPQMAFIEPVVDLEEKILRVSAPGKHTLELRLDEDTDETSESVVSVCGNKCGGLLWGDDAVSEWFSDFLGVRCWLARFSPIGYRHRAIDDQRNQHVAFANEQPILLISEEAVNALNRVLVRQKQKTVSTRHFRPNIVVRLTGSASTKRTNIEDGWSRLSVDGSDCSFTVAGRCSRCSMVDVDPSTGMKGKTLRALASYKRDKGHINFGIFLQKVTGDELWLTVGDTIECS